MPSRTVLLTGANGFLGSFLVPALIARGDTVRCLVRAASDTRSLKGTGALLIEGDVTDVPSVERAVTGADVVFHLAGIRRGATRDAFMAVNAEGTRNVAAAMARAGSRRLVLCGSLAASGPSNGGPPRVESDPFAPVEWYGESKAEAERIALSFNGPLEVTVSRPARIVGPRDRENLTFFRIASKGLVLHIGGPERRFSLVDVNDVVDHLVLLGERAEAVGEAFFCSSEETMTVAGLMGTVVELMGLTPRVVPVPVPVLRAVGAVADGVSTVTGHKLPVNRKLVRQLLSGWTCSIDKSRRILGYQPRRSVRAALADSLASYRELGWL